MKIIYCIKFLLIAISFSSCGFAIHLIGKQAAQNNGPVDTEGMTTIASPSNEDNVIYTTNKIFVFQVDQWVNKKHLTFELEMVVIPGSFNLNESKIKYKYRYNPTDLTAAQLKEFGYDSTGNFSPEITSFTESSSNLEFHPPRAKTLECLEAAPFPKIPYPIGRGKSAKSFMYIPRGNWGKLGGSTIKSIYKIDSIHYIKDSIPYSCRVSAIADSKKGGRNTFQTYFNIDSGFTKWSYRFEDSTAIDFTLKEIK